MELAILYMLLYIHLSNYCLNLALFRQIPIEMLKGNNLSGMHQNPLEFIQVGESALSSGIQKRINSIYSNIEKVRLIPKYTHSFFENYKLVIKDGFCYLT